MLDELRCRIRARRLVERSLVRTGELPGSGKSESKGGEEEDSREELGKHFFDLDRNECDVGGLWERPQGADRADSASDLRRKKMNGKKMGKMKCGWSNSPVRFIPQALRSTRPYSSR